MTTSRNIDYSCVALVNPAPDGGESASALACFPPLGLIQLGTAVRRAFPEMEVRIFDECVTPFGEIVRGLHQACIVGISLLTTTYRNGLKFAETAKEKGAFVVGGNDHASRFAEKIIQRRPFDAVLVGDHSEYPFIRLLEVILGRRSRLDLREISGLVGKFGGEIVANAPQPYSMELLPTPDRSLISHEIYRKNFSERFGQVLGSDHNPTTVNLCRGCAMHRKRCSFCDIFDLRLDHVSAERAWRELCSLSEAGHNYFWEVGDSFTSHLHWLKELSNCKPAGFSGELFVYARAQELGNIRTVSLLRQLGVSRVNIGMESGDNGALAFFKKGNLEGAETNYRAARNLKELGLRAHISLICGWPGESAASLNRTLAMMNSFFELGVVTSVDPSILYPLPGAPLWELIRDDSEFRDATETDLLPRDLRSRFNRRFCSIPLETLERFCDEINALAIDNNCVPGGFG